MNESVNKASVAHTAGQVGAAASITTGDVAGTDALLAGTEAVRREASRLLNVASAQSKGNLFEYIEAAKFNSQAAKMGSDLHAAITAAEGQPHAPADLVIREGMRVVREVQAKAGDSTARLAHSVGNDKYVGMQRLVPTDKAEGVGTLMDKRIETGTLKASDYEDARANLSGELNHDAVTSGGTTNAEAVQGAESPRLYTLKLEARQIAGEAAIAGAAAAGAGAVLSGSITLATGLWAVHRGEKTVEEAVHESGRAAGKSAIRSGAAGAGGAVIRGVASRTGAEMLAKSNVATTVAASCIDLGISTYSLVKGEITAEEWVEQAGQTGCNAMSSIYVGAAAGAIFGPPGALLGATAGYLLSNHTYQGTIAILRSARLSEEEAAIAVALAESAIREMDAQRALFDSQIEAVTQSRREDFASTFESIDAALSSEEVETTVRALADFASLFGQTLQFASFAEFDAFMIDGDESLRI